MRPVRLGWQMLGQIGIVALPLILLLAVDSGMRSRIYLPLALNPPPTPHPTLPVPAFSHIFIIIMENHEYDAIVGNAAAPYFNSLAQHYGIATNYYAIRHPSLPNYIALTAGSPYTITSNCTNCFLDVPNLADQVEGVGKTWRAYMEGMPAPCYLGNHRPYVQRHNPFIYFDDIRLNPTRCANIVPFTDFTADLQTNQVPNFVWITPDVCHDMHDCSVSTGDAWLQSVVPVILASPAWQQDGVLFITYDEGMTKAGCCTTAAGGRVATLVISPLGKPAYQSPVAYTHYSLLRTIEDAWHMPHLVNAGCDCSLPLADFFRTSAPAADRGRRIVGAGGWNIESG